MRALFLTAAASTITTALCRCTQAATSLYRYLAGPRGGNWEEVASNAVHNLYDAHEDTNSKSPEWHLEVDGAQVRGCCCCWVLLLGATVLLPGC